MQESRSIVRCTSLSVAIHSGGMMATACLTYRFPWDRLVRSCEHWGLETAPRGASFDVLNR